MQIRGKDLADGIVGTESLIRISREGKIELLVEMRVRASETMPHCSRARGFARTAARDQERFFARELPRETVHFSPMLSRCEQAWRARS